MTDTGHSANYVGAVSIERSRVPGTLHRSGILLVDKLIDYITASLTIADNGAGTGSLAASTTFYACAIPGNRWGPCMVNVTIDSLASAAYGGATGSYRFTMAQCVDAEWYDLFLSIDTAPKWVGRITEAMRAAGGWDVSAVGTYTASAAPAGTVDVNLVGTGIQTSNAVFAQNNAYVPNPAAATITPINCAGHDKAVVYVKLALTDLRSAPSLSIIPFFQCQASSGDWLQGTLEQISVLNAVGQSLEQAVVIDINGATGLVVLVDAIGGQGAAASIWVELI